MGLLGYCQSEKKTPRVSRTCADEGCRELIAAADAHQTDRVGRLQEQIDHLQKNALAAQKKTYDTEISASRQRRPEDGGRNLVGQVATGV